MTVEVATYPNQLNTTLPTSADFVSEGDDHLRLLKTVVKTTFPNFGGAFTATHTEANYLVGVTSNIQTQFTGKANTDSPVFTTAATLPAATTIGTVTAAEILRLSGVTSPIQTQLNAKGAIAGQTWTGAHSFTGATVAVPTVTAGDATNNAASTAFVTSTAFASALPGQSGNAGKFVTTNGSAASWAFPVLTMVLITNTTPVTAVPGNFYVFTVSGATLNVPTTFVQGDPLGFGMSRGVTSATVDWSTNKVKGRSPGVMSLLTQNDGAVCVFANTTDGFMEAA